MRDELGGASRRDRLRQLLQSRGEDFNCRPNFFFLNNQWRAKANRALAATEKEQAVVESLLDELIPQLTVLYRAKLKPGTKKNFAVFPVLDWIATLTAHIPNKGEQMVRYYGYYSNASRGKRKKEKPEEQDTIALDPQPVSKELKKRWSYFIRKVYETDPLTCPKCQGEMRIISFIDQPDIVKKILQHLGLWEESQAPPDSKITRPEITFDPSYSQLV